MSAVDGEGYEELIGMLDFGVLMDAGLPFYLSTPLCHFRLRGSLAEWDAAQARFDSALFDRQGHLNKEAGRWRSSSSRRSEAIQSMGLGLLEWQQHTMAILGGVMQTQKGNHAFMRRSEEVLERDAEIQRVLFGGAANGVQPWRARGTVFEAVCRRNGSEPDPFDVMRRFEIAAKCLHARWPEKPCGKLVCETFIHRASWEDSIKEVSQRSLDAVADSTRSILSDVAEYWNLWTSQWTSLAAVDDLSVWESADELLRRHWDSVWLRADQHPKVVDDARWFDEHVESVQRHTRRKGPAFDLLEACRGFLYSHVHSEGMAMAGDPPPYVVAEIDYPPRWTDRATGSDPFDNWCVAAGWLKLYTDYFGLDTASPPLNQSVPAEAAFWRRIVDDAVSDANEAFAQRLAAPDYGICMDLGGLR